MRNQSTKTLTLREAQVAALIAEGLSNVTIGAMLGISKNTVKFHVGHVSAKYGTRSRVVVAVRHTVAPLKVATEVST